jgi:hypothetical protein
MFATLSLKELQQLVRALKDNHNIAGFSRMKKDDLVKALSAHFVYLNGAIYLKFEDEDRAESQRIQNELDKAEAPAVEVKRPLTDAQFKRKVKLFLSSLKNPSALSLRDSMIQFKDQEGINMEGKRELFNQASKEFFIKQNEAPAAPKPREQLKRKFISFLDSTEIGKAKPTAIIKQFLDKESIDIGENKPFFTKVLKEWAADNK